MPQWKRMTKKGMQVSDNYYLKVCIM